MAAHSVLAPLHIQVDMYETKLSQVLRGPCCPSARGGERGRTGAAPALRPPDDLEITCRTDDIRVAVQPVTFESAKAAA